MAVFQNLRASSVTERPFAAQTAVTGAGNSGALTGYGNINSIRAQLNVTAITGTTPSLTVFIEDSVDGGATWAVVGTFTAVTAAGAQTISVAGPFGDQLRVRWAITGTTPSANFAVDWTVGLRL
jgi:hypothetical protein